MEEIEATEILNDAFLLDQNQEQRSEMLDLVFKKRMNWKEAAEFICANRDQVNRRRVSRRGIKRKKYDGMGDDYCEDGDIYDV